MEPILDITESIKRRDLEISRPGRCFGQDSCWLGHPNQLICRNPGCPICRSQSIVFFSGCAHPVRVSGPSLLEV